MEDHLFDTLGLKHGAQVLDAGCGVAHVAIHIAEKGLLVQGIDIVDHHIMKAQRNIEAQGLKAAVKVRKMDYHHLDAFAAASFDGVYTMETFVHATDPEGVLQEFLRVLKPEGKIALYEYDHRDMGTVSKNLRNSMDKVNEYAAMPTNTRFDEGVLERMLEEAGFEDIVLEDLSLNIRPMLRLFFAIAIIPYLFITLFGLEAWFVNTVAGVQGYRGRCIWRYVAVSARKPAGGKGNVNLGREGKRRE
jgi:sterol 24-C-methyltransferase